jgi:hypothetical protein
MASVESVLLDSKYTPPRFPPVPKCLAGLTLAWVGAPSTCTKRAQTDQRTAHNPAHRQAYKNVYYLIWASLKRTITLLVRAGHSI